MTRLFTPNDSDRFALVFHERYIAVYCDDLSNTFARSCFLFPSFSMRHRVRVTGSTPDSAFSAVLLIFPEAHALFRSRLRQGGCGCNHGSQCTRHHGQGRTEKADREHEVPGVHGAVALVKKHRGVSALRRQPNRHLHPFSCLSLFLLAYYLRTPLSI